MTKKPAIYDKLAGQISLAVGPIDVIEWLWVKDILDLSWEIRRLRGLRQRCLDLPERDARTRIL
jgi:hypothetical protein